MKQILKQLMSVLIVALFIPSAYSQKPSNKVFGAVKEYAKKNQKKELLSMQMLKSATEISYCFSNGAVAPEFQYYGKIIVTPNNVTLKIINQSRVCYTQTRTITSRQYSDFLTRLYSLGIKKNTEEYIPMCGGGVYELTLKKGSKTIFEGSEDEDIITSKGLLSDPFLPLLDSDMMDVYHDPCSTFIINDVFPVAQKKPNELGIYDMSGNIEEWCYDWYREYNHTFKKDYAGPKTGEKKILRGGSFFHSKSVAEVTYRQSANPGLKDAKIGFRLARKL